MNTRRHFLLVLGATFVVAPWTLFAQNEGRVWRLGFLASRSREDSVYPLLPLRLKELGYTEGKNLVIEWRFAGGDYERLPELAAELVKLHVDAIVTDGTQGIRAAENATKTIPIVFVGGSDVVADGLVKSLARPGGNTTGITFLYRDSIGKEIEILVAIVPALSRLAVLLNPANQATRRNFQVFESAGRTAGLHVVPVYARTPAEVESAFSSMIKARSDAFVWMTDSFLIQQSRQIAALARKHRLPSLTEYPLYAQDGGLVSYGVNRPEVYGLLAGYVDKIFKGANPGDLPVQQPTKFDLIVNGETAKSLGLTIPPELLLLATKVID